MLSVQEIVCGHPFFSALPGHVQELLIGCASYIRFGPNQVIFREGGEAKHFYLIGPGRVALDTFIPDRGHITVQTIHEGEVLGWSWLFPPYRWHFGALALAETQAVVFDGLYLRNMCESDAELGYQLMKRFALLLMQRLHATRLRLLELEDLYAGLLVADRPHTPSPLR